VREKLTRLRDETTPPKIFRELVAEIATLLLYEATADLPTEPREVKTPLAPYKGARLKDKVGLIPVLRAGIGMVEAALELMPEAQVWHIGLFRDERTLRPISYYNKLPSSATVQICLVLDPMLATGGSATATIDVLKKWGAKRIKYVGIIAAPEGVRALVSAHPDVPIHVAALDERLNEKGYILPGLGDAGDRQFGTG
jgi:uracil phosphoribosyltransferase